MYKILTLFILMVEIPILVFIQIALCFGLVFGPEKTTLCQHWLLSPSSSVKLGLITCADTNGAVHFVRKSKN